MLLTERGSRMIIVISVLVGLATIAVVLRVVARLKLSLKIGIDDYLCLAALVCLYGMLVELILWCIIGGNGSHFEDLDRETKSNFSKIFLSNQFTYFILCPVLRISFVCFYRRIFATERFQRISFGVNCLIGLWGAAIFLACALQCRPLKGYWDKSVHAKCFDGNTFFIVNQMFNVVMDFVILGLPLPIIWKLNRSSREKAALSGIFAIGGFICFASIYRIVVLFYIDPNDITYTVYQATLWTHIEPSVGIICCCLPSIRGLLPKYIFSGKRTQTSSSKTPRRASVTTEIPSQYGPGSMYMQMSDFTASRAESDEEQLVTEGMDRGDRGGITVKTDINVVRGGI